MRLKLAPVILLLCVAPAFGQTALTIETEYGKPVKAYAVSEHIWMTPEYAADGQVCEMRLYPKRISTSTNYLSRQLPFEELKQVLKQLVPLDQRGAKAVSFGATATGGGAAWTTYPYEKVTFVFTHSFKVDPESWKDSSTYVFSVADAPPRGRPENAAPSDADFSRSRASAAEIVTIKWNDRKCARN